VLSLISGIAGNKPVRLLLGVIILGGLFLFIFLRRRAFKK
jgi:hypothetical protein